MDLVTATEAARRRGDVSPETVRRWVRKGWIKAQRVGNYWMVDPAEVLAFEPPTVGWPAGVKRCPHCKEALTPDHVCKAAPEE